jgi:acyl transferase domain-containing protein
MGRQLFTKYSAFRHSVYECDEACRVVMGFSLVESSGLFVEPRHSASASGSGKLNVSSEWTVTLPALTILQIALFDLLGSFVIKPDVVLEHSVGEPSRSPWRVRR